MTPAAPGTIRTRVPRGDFRGPAGNRTIGPIDPALQQQTERNLSGWVRGQNSLSGQRNFTRPERDTVGNLLPAGTRFFRRDDNRFVSRRFGRMESRLGDPSHSFFFRRHGDFDRDDRHFRHHDDDDFVAFFFYPFYFANPFGFYNPGFYPSVYSSWGWGPSYIYPDRVYNAPLDYGYGGYGAYGSNYDMAGVRSTLNDLRQAWLEGDIDRLARHLTDRVDIGIYFGNDYSYTTSTDDFYAMTADTLATFQVVTMDFARPVRTSPREVFVSARQVYYDPDGVKGTMYLSYRLRQIGADWYVVAAGSSQDPIASPLGDVGGYNY